MSITQWLSTKFTWLTNMMKSDPNDTSSKKHRLHRLELLIDKLYERQEHILEIYPWIYPTLLITFFALGCIQILLWGLIEDQTSKYYDGYLFTGIGACVLSISTQFLGYRWLIVINFILFVGTLVGVICLAQECGQINAFQACGSLDNSHTLTILGKTSYTSMIQDYYTTQGANTPSCYCYSSHSTTSMVSLDGLSPCQHMFTVIPSLFLGDLLVTIVIMLLQIGFLYSLSLKVSETHHDFHILNKSITSESTLDEVQELEVEMIEIDGDIENPIILVNNVPFTTSKDFSFSNIHSPNHIIKSSPSLTNSNSTSTLNSQRSILSRNKSSDESYELEPEQQSSSTQLTLQFP